LRERIAFGFNADETRRIVRSCEYNTLTQQAFYPLLEWDWTRAKCVDYIREKLGATWRKSACVYCPFNALKNDAIDRHLEHPEQVADPLLLEHMSMALNPRGTLYKGTSLIQIATKSGNDKALNGYRQRIESGRWAQYRVRRVYTRKGQADRAVEKLDVFSGAVEARAHLAAIAATLGLPFEEQKGIPYVWRHRRSETEFPTREEFWTIAPAIVESKARGGLAWFDAKWSDGQMDLF
jgi:hypothetical protein